MMTRDDVIKMWNETRHSASEIAAASRGKFSASAVCGIVHRARAKGLITRPAVNNARPGPKRKKTMVSAERSVVTIRVFNPAPRPTDQSYWATMHDAVHSLRPLQCRWPIDDGKVFKFCDCEATVGFYCAAHAQASTAKDDDNG